MTEVKTNIVQ